jgi:hypothetical protein
MHKSDLDTVLLKRQPTLDITRSIWYQVRAHVNKLKVNFIQSARDHIAELYDLHHFESDAEHLEFIDSLLADIKYLFRVAVGMEDGVHGTNPMKIVLKAAKKLPASTLLPGGSNPAIYRHQILHWATNLGKYADRCYKSIIHDNDSHIPSPLIMFTWAALCHTPRE